MDAYNLISREEAGKLGDVVYKHAAHVMLYAPVQEKQLGKYEYRYAVMMQLRFDGTLGFPGGIVDSGETPEDSVSREFVEEMGTDPGELIFTSEDYVATHVSEYTRFCLHFFAREVNLEKFMSIEKRAPSSEDWGQEVLGIVRCPLYTLPNGLGFPAFLKHQFIGNSRDQLLMTIQRRGLLSSSELDLTLKRSATVSSLVTVEDTDI